MYNGTSHTIGYSVSGCCGDDDIGLVVTNTTNTNAGIYTAVSSITNTNYVIKEGKDTCTYVIAKATVDMNSIQFNNETIEFSGSIYVPSVTNLPEMLNVDYLYVDNI